MPEVSLVPVDHQPDFDTHSLVPVDYDPFAAEKFANPAVESAITGLATLPQRAIQNSQYSLGTGNYDPGPTLEAATLPMGTGAIAGVPVRAGEAVLGAGPIRAYHGSPHDFEAFDLSKIGTGEGAQAYGHGLYMAESEGVAKSYRDNLARDTFRSPNGDIFDPSSLEHLNVRVAARDNGVDLDATLKRAHDLYENPSMPPQTKEMIARDIEKLRGLKAAGGVQPNSGHMYEVNINADPEHFLDWDKPLSEQSQHVQQTLERERLANPALDPRGINIYHNARPVSGDLDEAASRLRDAGIPGIKYLDQGSRASGDGTKNYVVFNDSIVQIMRKYGIAGLSLLPPAVAASVKDQWFKPVDHNPFSGDGT